MSYSKILEAKIKSNTIEDILENPELFYQMILEFHQMNIDAQFDTRPYPSINFNKITVIPSDSKPCKPRLSMCSSLSEHDKELQVSIFLFVPPSITESAIIKMVESIEPIYREQMCRFLFLENRHCLFTTRSAIRNHFDDTSSSKEIVDYMLMIRDKYFKN